MSENEKWSFNSIPIKSRAPKETVSQQDDAAAVVVADPDLIENPYAALEDKGDPKVPTATLQIYQYIDEYLARKQDKNVNRASAATMCFKRRWYQQQGVPGDNMTPRKSVNFLLGDLSERALLYFIRQGCVGPGKLYSQVDFGKVAMAIHFQGKEIQIYEQEHLTAHIPGLDFPISAHADGFGKRNSDGKWELIECKSAANYGFQDFKVSGPRDYLKQAHVLMMTDKAKQLGIRDVRFFYLRKETGHLYDRLFPFDPELAEEVKNEFWLVSQKEEPKAPYVPRAEKFRSRPTGRKILGFPCAGYCPYVEKCQPAFKVEWKSDQFGFMRPVYVVKEEKEGEIQ